MPSFARERLSRTAALIAIIIAGLIWRRADLGLPFFWWKYVGSGLWGAMVFVIVGIVAPGSSIAKRVLAATLIAIAVEFSRLYHEPGLDAFRLTLAGALLLGRVFSL
jgi:hypothetical protein